MLAGLRPLSAVEPEVLEWIAGGGDAQVALPSWAGGFGVAGGELSAGGWKFAGDEPTGAGRIDIELSDDAGIHALALTLAFEDVPGTDLAVQLYDRGGRLLAVDLFGNLAESAAAGRTDTFIVPLAEFPRAASVSLRRIHGPLTFYGLIAYPVVESLDGMNQEDREAFARMLGERLAQSSPTLAAADAAGGRLRERSDNPTASRLIGASDYPQRFWREPLPRSRAFRATVSGTCFRFFTTIYLQVFSNPEHAGKVAFTSSSGAHAAVLGGNARVALASYPPASEQLGRFERSHGFALQVLPIALDAVEVLVHPRNQFDSMDMDTLRRVFGTQPEGALRWDRESGIDGPILIAGGRPSWGTSRFFAQRVLGGGGFRDGLVELDVAYPHGVEQFVASNRNAIGFAQHRRRTHAVKPLAVAADGAAPVAADALSVGSGRYPLSRNLYLLLAYPEDAGLPAPVGRFCDFLLSRDGQSAVAGAGSFPLSAAAVARVRARLRLP